MRTSTFSREIIKRVLELLREWGWATGVERLKAELDAAKSEDERASLQLFIGWLAGERGFHAEALKQLRALRHLPQLKAWALVGQAFVMLREASYKNTHKLLDQAREAGPSKDKILQASIAHCRGSAYYHVGCTKQAMNELRAALDGFGRDHFCTGRVLDSIGMIYSSKNHFHAARELYSLALKHKQRHGDDAGCAVSQGQLGRLYMDWEQFDRAEHHFRNDLQLSRAMGATRNEALVWNQLARISLAHKNWDQAVYELGQCLQLSEGRDWKVLEGYAHKDLASAFLGQQNTRKASVEIRAAKARFEAAKFPEGLMHLERVRGVLLRMQGKFTQAENCFQYALRHFEQLEEHGEAARTQFEIAKTLRSRGSKVALSQLTTALDRAEKCRRDALVKEIEADLKEVDALEYYRRIFQRARGRNVEVGTDSLFSGKAEMLTVLFLDVQGSTEFGKAVEPEDVMITMNQMTAEFVGILERYTVSISGYRGDGFMALVRDRNHARRAVAAGLEMIQAMEEFNAPRELIQEYEDPLEAAEMKPLVVRIGIATGEVFLGNVGTYDKMDFTALGTTANLAARLEAEAEPQMPCISQATYEKIRNEFVFSKASGRSVRLKGFEDTNIRVWDVVASKEVQLNEGAGRRRGLNARQHSRMA